MIHLLSRYRHVVTIPLLLVVGISILSWSGQEGCPCRNEGADWACSTEIRVAEQVGCCLWSDEDMSRSSADDVSCCIVFPCGNCPQMEGLTKNAPVILPLENASFSKTPATLQRSLQSHSRDALEPTWATVPLPVHRAASRIHPHLSSTVLRI